MPPTGIQTFYYGKNLPARAIAIAQVTAEDVSPATAGQDDGVQFGHIVYLVDL